MTPSPQVSCEGAGPTPAAQRSRRLESLITAATGVAHELNNSMACVLGNNGIILRSLAGNSPLEENAVQIDEAAQRTAELARQLVFFTGRASLNLSEVHLSHLIRGMEGTLKAIVGHGIPLHLHTAEHIPPLKADAEQLRIVVTNLVRNAADFLVNRHGSVTVATGWLHCHQADLAQSYYDDGLRPGPFAFVEVTDGGCGIPADVMERIFDPFFTKKIRAPGMGLSVAIGIVRAHRGAMIVRSEPGKGSSFRVLLPCGAAKK